MGSKVADKFADCFGSDFKQQQLKAWQPLYRPRTVVTTLAVLGAVCVALGVPALVSSVRTREVVLDYDKLCRAAIAKGADARKLFAIPAREQIGRAKSVPEDKYAEVYAQISEQMNKEIEAIVAKGGDEV